MPLSGRMALAALALVLAGCTAPTAPAPEAEPAPEVPAALAPIEGPPAFAPPVRVTVLSHAGPQALERGPIPQEEPYLHADAEGRLYLATPHVPALFRSDDAGATFATLFDVRTQEGNRTAGFTDAAFADAPGALYWLGLDFQGEGASRTGSLPFQTSRDAGQSWSEPFLVAEGGVDRQWLTASPQGDLVAIWTGQGVHARASRDGGASWAPETQVQGIGFAGAVIAGRTPGVFYIPGNEYQVGTVAVAKSVDHGATWNTTIASPPLWAGGLVNFGPIVTVVPMMAEDQAGNLYVVYAADDPPVPGAPAYVGKPVVAQAVFLVVSRDGGATWSAPLRLSEPGHNAVLPWVVARAPGRVAVAWYEDDRGTNRMTPSLWHTVLAVSGDAAAEAPTFHKAPTTAEPAHAGRICNECGDFSRLDHLGLALTLDGRPVVAWIRDGADEPTALDVMVSVVQDVSLGPAQA